jgi:type IV secretory pathway component VirB8
MNKKTEEFQIETNEEKAEYLQFVKTSAEDGTYFKDALDWYFFRYVTPICDRTLLIFGSIIASVVLFFLVKMINLAYPLVEKVPVFIAAKDQSIYFPNIVPLKPKKGKENFDQELKTVDEAIAKYMLSVYVKERESYDFSKAETDKVNQKFNRIKNLSTSDEYRNFQLIMSPENPNSPIKDFGNLVVKRVKIESVKFVRKEAKGFSNQAREFLSVKIPTEAEVRFSTSLKTSTENSVKEENERYLAKISFALEGINKNEKGAIKFIVNSYKLFKIK